MVGRTKKSDVSHSARLHRRKLLHSTRRARRAIARRRSTFKKRGIRNMETDGEYREYDQMHEQAGLQQRNVLETQFRTIGVGLDANMLSYHLDPIEYSVFPEGAPNVQQHEDTRIATRASKHTSARGLIVSSARGCLSILRQYPFKDDIEHPSLYPLFFNTPTLHSVGSMNNVCNFCHAQLWREETRTNMHQVAGKYCCKLGRVSLLPLEEPPEILRDLLHGTNAKSKSFRKNIRAYNSVMAFVSLGAQIDERFSKDRGVHNFRVHGSIYHRVGALLPNEARQEAPCFAQLYVYDT